MFDHLSIGARDIAKAKAFYDAALKPLELPASAPTRLRSAMAKRPPASGSSRRSARSPTIPSPDFTSALPRRAARASTAFHKAAMAHGGRDNGKPGLRKDYGPHYYAAFVFDPEGYRLEAYYGGK